VCERKAALEPRPSSRHYDAASLDATAAATTALS